MGTNYFMLTNRCDCCGRADELHIGKSSGGWRMLLRSYSNFDEEGPTTWDEWKTALANCDAIRDEYGRDVEATALFDRVTGNANNRRHEHHGSWADGPVDLYRGSFS